jgi:hypothetical protein
MRTFRAEVTGNGSWQQTSLPFNANRVHLRHIAGSCDISISFNGTTATTVKLSPEGGTYEHQADLEIENAVSQIGVNALADHTVEIVAWL